MSIFNRILLGKNIRLLATQKGIKVGDIEDFANVSKGYFSRLANDDGKNSSTIVDTICKVAEKLGVSVNTLISTDLSSLTPNETLLSKFFDKLCKDTIENRLTWNMETKNKLDSFLEQGGHPMFSPDHQGYYGTQYYYHSEFDSNINIDGDAYNVSINKKQLYIFKVYNPQKNISGFELYFVTYDGFSDIGEPICNVYSESSLFGQINDLYNAAAESSRHVKLSDFVRNTISEYMKDNNYVAETNNEDTSGGFTEEIEF